MNTMTKIRTPQKPAEQLLSLSDLQELIAHNRMAYQISLEATKQIKDELTRLGREQARRDGQLIMPSFERILIPVKA